MSKSFPTASADRITSGERDSPYPPLLSSAEVSRSISGILSNTETSSISYYEPSGEGRWRICRRERWLPPVAEAKDYHKDALIVGKEYVSSNSRLAQATMGHMPLRALMYYYDSKGRIARIEEGDFAKKREPAKIKICRKYDDQDRLLLFLDPKTTQICQPDQPDVRDGWIRYEYGAVDGEQVTVWNELHHGDQSGKWKSASSDFAPALVQTTSTERLQLNRTRV